MARHKPHIRRKDKIPSRTDFSRRLRIAMACRDLRGDELAQLLYYHPQTVYNWISRTADPGPGAIEAICDKFHVSRDWLLGIAPISEFQERIVPND